MAAIAALSLMGAASAQAKSYHHHHHYEMPARSYLTVHAGDINDIYHPDVVWFANSYIGRDPDLRIRSALRREFSAFTG
jgi:hypothetical protein